MLPFYWKKHPHIILVVSDDCHQFPIFSSFFFLFSLFLGVLAAKNNLFKYMYRQCPFFLGILVVSHIKGNNDISIVPLLHNLPNAYFRLVCYPFVILTFVIPEKILLEIFHILLETSQPIVVEFNLRMQTSITITIFLQSSTNLNVFLFFYTDTAVKTCPN